MNPFREDKLPITVIGSLSSEELNLFKVNRSMSSEESSLFKEESNMFKVNRSMSALIGLSIALNSNPIKEIGCEGRKGLFFSH